MFQNTMNGSTANAAQRFFDSRVFARCDDGPIEDVQAHWALEFIEISIRRHLVVERDFLELPLRWSKFLGIPRNRRKPPAQELQTKNINDVIDKESILQSLQCTIIDAYMVSSDVLGHIKRTFCPFIISDCKEKYKKTAFQTRKYSRPTPPMWTPY